MALLKKAAHGAWHLSFGRSSAWHLTPLHVGTLLSEEPIMRERRAVRQTNLWPSRAPAGPRPAGHSHTYLNPPSKPEHRVGSTEKRSSTHNPWGEWAKEPAFWQAQALESDLPRCKVGRHAHTSSAFEGSFRRPRVVP